MSNLESKEQTEQLTENQSQDATMVDAQPPETTTIVPPTKDSNSQKKRGNDVSPLMFAMSSKNGAPPRRIRKMAPPTTSIISVGPNNPQELINKLVTGSQQNGEYFSYVENDDRTKILDDVCSKF